MILAGLWSGLAALLRQWDQRHGTLRFPSDIRSLCGLALPLAAAGAVALATFPDQLGWASRLGWLLPLTCLAIWFALRQAVWREVTILLLSLWVGSSIVALSMGHDWWEHLAISSRCGILVVVIALVLLIVERFWLSPAPSWGTRTLVLAGWLTLLVGFVGPAGTNLLLNLGWTVSPSLPSSWVNWSLAADRWLALLALSTLMGVSLWLGRRGEDVWVLTVTCLFPVGTVLVAAASFSPPSALPLALGLAAAWLILSDWLPLARPRLQPLSIAAWEPPSDVDVNRIRAGELSLGQFWLSLARWLLVAGLTVATVMVWVQARRGELPSSLSPESSSWLRNVAVLLLVFGPGILFTTLRWLLTLWQGEPARRIVLAAMSASLIIGTLIGLAQPGGPTPWQYVISLLQGFGIAAASFAWASLILVAGRNAAVLRAAQRDQTQPTNGWDLMRRSVRGARWRNGEEALWWLAGGAICAVMMLSATAFVTVVAYPTAKLDVLHRLGHGSVIVTAIVSLGLYWLLWVMRGASQFALLALALGLTAPLLAVSYASWLQAAAGRTLAGAGDFEPIRLLVALWLGSLLLGLMVRVIALRRQRPLRSSAEGAWVWLAALVGCLGLLSAVNDPRPIWPLLELSFLALVTVLSGVVSGQAWRGHVAAPVAAAGIGAVLYRWSALDSVQQGWNLLWGPVWVAWVFLVAQRWLMPLIAPAQISAEEGRAARPEIDRIVSVVVAWIGCFLSFVCLVGYSRWLSDNAWANGAILALTATGLALAVARLWSPGPSQRGLAVYWNVIALGLVGSTYFCGLFELPRAHAWLLWLVSGLGAMALMAGCLRELIREASVLGPRLGLHSIVAPDRYLQASQWIPGWHCIAALAALVPSVTLVLAFEEQTLRVAATTLPFLGALTILPLGAVRGEAVFRYCGLSLLSTSFVLFWWADLPSAWVVAWPHGGWPFVQRAMLAFVLLGIVYPWLACRWQRQNNPAAALWQRPLTHIGWITLALGVCAGIGLIVGQALAQWRMTAEEASLAARLSILLAWAAIAARGLQFAANPQGLDAQASIPLRKAAAFAAEVAIGLLALACYFHFPELFRGRLAAWWPLIVFGIAILSAAIGHWMRRINQPIIGDPLQQSGLVLPLIPLLVAGWYRPNLSAWHWGDWDSYALLLLIAAGLYGLHGWSRRSQPLQGFAALLTLAGFWSFLHSQPDLRFFAHPQFWLLPPAVATLVFVELQRWQLDAKTVAATRYTTLLIAYLSSSAESLLLAMEGRFWQPLLLLVLALGGVAAGILLRVREFLYCGSAFTFVALLGMVWHAQQAIGHVWPWWAFGIVTGISLIAFLGYLEKNKTRE